jgi:hypothetical protein
MKLCAMLLASAAAIGFWGAAADAATIVISVGPGGEYQTIGDAVAAANEPIQISTITT